MERQCNMIFKKCLGSGDLLPGLVLLTVTPVWPWVGHFSSLLFSCSVTSNSLWPHGLQHIRLPCPLLSPRICSDLCPPSQWCHPSISSSVTPFSSCPQSFLSGSFPLSRLLASGGQKIGASVSESVLPRNISLEVSFFPAMKWITEAPRWSIESPSGFFSSWHVSVTPGGLVTKSCPTLVTPWTVAGQAPLSMGFSRQKYWSGLPFPSPGTVTHRAGKAKSGMQVQGDSISSWRWYLWQRSSTSWAEQECNWSWELLQIVWTQLHDRLWGVGKGKTVEESFKSKTTG